jgi:hypothetical protein
VLATPATERYQPRQAAQPHALPMWAFLHASETDDGPTSAPRLHARRWRVFGF